MSLPDDRALIVRSQRPLNLESPIAALDHPLTPNDRFFVRSHFGAPAVDLGPWEVEVVGLVDRPLRLSLAELARLEQTIDGQPCSSAPATGGACIGRACRACPGSAAPSARRNGRASDWPTCSSVPGSRPGAAHVHFFGGDAPPSPKTPAFVRSIPLDRALDPGTILATRMNGEPLPALHGGPLRLVVPGWTGNNWLKWVRKIVVAREEAPGFYMQTAYRMPPPAGAPGTGSQPARPDAGHLDERQVADHLAASRGQVIPAGPSRSAGSPGPGKGTSPRSRSGSTATVDGSRRRCSGEPEPGRWRPWRLNWEPDRRGRHVLAARATDSMGQVQPETPPWNKSGYLWNGIDSVDCEIG